MRLLSTSCVIMVFLKEDNTVILANAGCAMKGMHKENVMDTYGSVRAADQGNPFGMEVFFPGSSSLFVI